MHTFVLTEGYHSVWSKLFTSFKNLKRLSENAHLPFDRPFDRLTVLSKVEGLTALSKVEGLRYPHPSSLRRTSIYASFLGISEALHLDIFHQPLRNRLFDSL
jgi:hypothetical protein